MIAFGCMPSRHDSLPRFIEPQLSLLVKAPPTGAGWAHELKYDGYRIHALLEGGKARLLTRTGLDWTERYAATARAVSAIEAESAYLDGELCAVRPDGTTSFPEMQAATDAGRTGQLVYFAFDLLFLDGERLMARPLLERKERLRKLLKRAPPSIRYSDHHLGDGARFLEAACAAKVEGVVSKRVDAPYAPGNRGIWQKSKCLNREEFIIVGYTEPEGARQHIGALLLGFYDDAGASYTPGASVLACLPRNCAGCTRSSSRSASQRCRWRHPRDGRRVSARRLSFRA